MLKRLVESKLTTAPAAGTTSEWTWVASRADMPVQHRDLSALYATWLRAKGTVGDLPALSDFSADDLDQWLGRICLVQQGEQELELEVLGCCLTDQYGHDISRQPLSAATSGPLGEDARDSPHHPDNIDAMQVVYTGTHDNDTTLGWWQTLDVTSKANVIKLTGQSNDIVGSMIELGKQCRAQLCVIPLQDVLRLDSSGRMNVPGVERGNWEWRFQWQDLLF